MKFSFIRFFREELAWLAAHDLPYYELFISALRNGVLVVDMLRGERLDAYIQQYRNIEKKPCCAELLLDVMAKRSSGFVEAHCGSSEVEPYIKLSEQACELLPQYIPELAR